MAFTWQKLEFLPRHGITYLIYQYARRILFENKLESEVDGVSRVAHRNLLPIGY